MLSTVLRTVRAHGLCQPGDRVLVAVSGGPDSMALLHALWELRARLLVELEAVTIDHGLRAGAAAEAELVRERAGALEVPWRLVRVDVAAARRRSGGSLQEVARRLRLAALAELAAERGARWVALGHQADDQAETVLFRIVRGTGLRGLRGIPYRRDPFVRPLLDVPRDEILRYLRRRSIGFAEDPSNADERFARARLRHRLMPLLAAENPRVREALLGLAAAARRAPAAPAPDRALPDDVGRRAAEVVARLRERGAGTRQVDVGGRRTVEVSYGKVLVRPRSVAAAEPAPGAVGPPRTSSPISLPITAPGVYAWPGTGVLIVRAGRSDIDPLARARAAGEGGVCFDADAIRWPLTARARRPGDRMRPRGGRGSRKLSDLLIDAKIARNARAGLPVLLTADGVVLYVPGLRPAEHGRPTASTKRMVTIEVRANERDEPKEINGPASETPRSV
jgi:tRNA(Ile)-lysidine synthase